MAIRSFAQSPVSSTFRTVAATSSLIFSATGSSTFAVAVWPSASVTTAVRICVPISGAASAPQMISPASFSVRISLESTVSPCALVTATL